MKLKSFITYSAKITEENLKASKNYHPVIFQLQFPSKAKNIHEEVLIFDEIGLISSLGGALGLFIGFSIFGYVATLLDTIVDKGFDRYDCF